MKKKIDPNLLIAIGVLISSFSALFVYMKQANIMSKQTEILLEQTKASAWPRVSINTVQSGTGENLQFLKLMTHNKGTGPAVIEGVRVSYNDEILKNWWDLFEKIKVPDSLDTSIAMASINNSVVSANENFYWIEIDNPELARWIGKKQKKITIEICYKSVFNDYWLLRKEGLEGISIVKKLEDPKSPIPVEEMFGNQH